MSMPVIPTVTQPQALTNLLESIALEETALAHFMNAEAEKVQIIAALLGNGTITPAEATTFQNAVNRLMQTAIKMQMLLEFKLENVIDAKLVIEGFVPPTPTPTPTP